ncbi:MAG: glycosyltransferase [Methanomassiliicoccaceae archaeon]|nr:glycosyltransferase [Methanomassiliicoccaceae archaeon]MCL2143657.1 glycosyltransferase [Methanomassiliicoccaceae archaeon]
MKIAMMVDSHHPVRDGVVAAIDTLRKGLEERGHDVILIAPDPGKGNRVEGVHYIPAKSFGTFEGYYLPIFPSDSIFRLKEMGVDVINVHGFAFMAVRGIACGKLLDVPVVITFHTPVWDFIGEYSPFDPEFSLKVGWSYFRRLFKRADVTVAQTPSIAKELKENNVKANVRVIPTGIDTGTMRPGIDGSVIRERYGIAEKKVLIHVGRLCPEKCLDVLIKAMTMLSEDVVLMIVGKGASEAELKALTADLGLTERIIFTGFVSDAELPLHYAAADAAVSSSIYEAQCLAIMDAMACGLPVACPHGRAFVDFIVDGENGFMFDASPEGCAEAIKKCLSADPSIGVNARTTAVSYSISRSVDAYVSLFEELVSTRQRR